MARISIWLTVVGCFLASALAEDSTGQELLKIRNRFAFIADSGVVAPFAHQCLSYQNVTQLTIQHLISLIGRLEDEASKAANLSLFNSPEKIARMLLQRFNMDSVNLETLETSQVAESIAKMDSQIVGLLSGLKSVDYNFPDYIFTHEELCTLLFTFSHSFPGHSEERGIVSFNGDPTEAIAPAKVLAGIIAALTEKTVLSGKVISAKLIGTAISQDVHLSDAILAVTLAGQMGSASFYQFQSNPHFDERLIYGIKGTWIGEKYVISKGSPTTETDDAFLRKLKFSHRASLAEIRGALDGYIIGKSYQSNPQQARKSLSSLLGLYYAQPQIELLALSPNYCQRGDHLPGVERQLKQIGLDYNRIYNFVNAAENSVYKGALLFDALSEAATTQTNFCKQTPSIKNAYKIVCHVEEL